MKQPNFKKSIIDYFENRKKSKKSTANSKKKGLLSSLSASTPAKTKRLRNRKEKERRFIKYHVTPLAKSDTQLNFKPSFYNVPDMETPVNQTVSPEPKAKEKTTNKTQIIKPKKNTHNTTELKETPKKTQQKPLVTQNNEKRKKTQQKPLVTQNNNKNRYSSVDIERPLNDLRKSILSIL